MHFKNHITNQSIEIYVPNQKRAKRYIFFNVLSTDMLGKKRNKKIRSCLYS